MGFGNGMITNDLHQQFSCWEPLASSSNKILFSVKMKRSKQDRNNNNKEKRFTLSCKV